MSNIEKVKVVSGSDPHPFAEVKVEGMSDCHGGAPICLEFFQGKWTLHVWSDINQEDPTHSIDMSGAFKVVSDGE